MIHFVRFLSIKMLKSFSILIRRSFLFLFQVRAEIQAQLKGDRIKDVLAQLKGCPAGLDPALSRSISFGVAYHHAGLTFDERDIVEGIYSIIIFYITFIIINIFIFNLI